MNSKLFSLLLHDTVRLIRPLPVTTPSLATQTTEINPISHPHLNLILTLSDLRRVFEVSLSQRKSHVEQNHVTHKLMFYAAHILSTPSPVLCALVEEILQRTLAYEETSNVPVSPPVKRESRVAIIEEI
jgi:hypothetical protein